MSATDQEIASAVHGMGWTITFSEPKKINGMDKLFWHNSYIVTVMRITDNRKLKFRINASPAYSAMGVLPPKRNVLDMIYSYDSEESTIEQAREFNYGQDKEEYSDDLVGFLVALGNQIRAFLIESEYEVLSELAEPNGCI